MARDPVARGLRDQAEVGPDPDTPRELRRLSELRYQVADGEPDIRGWSVFTSTGREIGRVSDLLVDPDAGEVVMLDVDLRRNDRHTLAPLRAVWIDHATRRVVLDARAAEQAMAAGDAVGGAGLVGPGTDAAVGTESARDDTDAGFPALPRAGTLSDDDVRRFNDDYARTYGTRGVEADRSYRLRRGDEELRFGGGPRRLLDPAPPVPSALAAATPPRPEMQGTAMQGTEARFTESEDINARLAGGAMDTQRRAAAHTAPGDAELGDGRLGDPGLAAAAARTDAAFARAPEPAVERRGDRVDDAGALDESAAIDPRELDARVRIEEGGTVDERTPVGGVRYEGTDPAPHRYGQPADAYGPEYGSGRIGFDKVVSRGPYAPGEADASADEDRPLRYRQYDDRYRGPGEGR